MITNAPWYVSNLTLHEDLNIPYVREVIFEKYAKHHRKLETHPNPSPDMGQPSASLLRVWKKTRKCLPLCCRNRFLWYTLPWWNTKLRTIIVVALMIGFKLSFPALRNSSGINVCSAFILRRRKDVGGLSRLV